ncbi:MAG TPA: hypothetical protein VI485_18010 [Vicinamibacterales bacterium]|nr:hypothetical protein [Vicinamibacterales bacterium]
MRDASIAPRTPALAWIVLVVLLASTVSSQVWLEGALSRPTSPTSVLWVRSPALMRRLTLGFNAIWADIYWIRAVQYYGDTKLSAGDKKAYDLLYPLLDMTTTLDPRFNIAYRFGAVLLSEAYPIGPGQTEQAIALLEKGIRESPTKWQYFHDAGFVEYWWRGNSEAAARWFLKGAALPGAPNWLQPLAASVLAEGGERDAARSLWLRLAETAEHEWLRQAARRAIMQLDAEAQIAALQPVVNRFYDQAGRFPMSWLEMVRAGLLRGMPVDPSNEPYALDPVSGAVDVAKTSELYPLKRGAPLAEPSH